MTSRGPFQPQSFHEVSTHKTGLNLEKYKKDKHQNHKEGLSWTLALLAYIFLLTYLVWFGWFLRFVPLLQILSEINKGFHGLGPLNQAAIQAARIIVSPFTEIQTEPSITIILVRFKSPDLAISQKNVRRMESYHRLDASSVPMKQNIFSFKNKFYIFPSLLCLQCWFSSVGSYCTISLLEDHKTQKELLGRWPQNSQHNAKCHSFPQAGILEKSSRLSETKAAFPKWMSDAFAAVPTTLLLT